MIITMIITITMISFLLALDHHRHDCHHLITVRTQDNGADEYEQLTDRIKANNESTLSPNTVVIQRLIQDRPVQFRRFCPISLSPELPMMPILWTNRTIAVSGPNNIFGDASFSSRKVSVGAWLYNWIGAALWPDLIFQINKQNLCTYTFYRNSSGQFWQLLLLLWKANQNWKHYKR